MSPDVLFRCNGNGQIWPDAALWLWSLATRQATRILVSNANVRMLASLDGYRINESCPLKLHVERGRSHLLAQQLADRNTASRYRVPGAS